MHLVETWKSSVNVAFERTNWREFTRRAERRRAAGVEARINTFINIPEKFVSLVDSVYACRPQGRECAMPPTSPLARRGAILSCRSARLHQIYGGNFSAYLSKHQ